MPKAIRRVRSALVLTTSLIAVAGLPSQVWAQETAPSAKAASAEDKSGTDSPDIVVTATRRELRLQDVPLSISAVDGERLSELGARDVQDYVLTIPGVSFTDASGGRQTFVVRGIASLGAGATTAVYLDETPLDIDLRLFDIARVEVLRGPQGTLYGQSSMGGAIRTITNRPDSTGFAAAVDASINSVHRGGAGGDVNVMVNVPLVTDKLAVRGVYYHEREAGFVDNYAVLDRIPGEVRDPSSAPVTPTTLIKKNRGAHDIDGARLMVQFDPVERLSISGTYLWQKDHYNGLNSEDTDIGRGRLIQSRAFDEIWGTEVQQYNLTARYDAGFAELMSSTTWNRATGRTARDVTYVFMPVFQKAYDILVNDGQNVADLLGAPSVNERTRSHQFTQELRLTSQGDGPVGWVIGGYYNNYSLPAG
ncbi:MAG: TonB-dependent receptor [Sphingomonadales bacterium]|nr:TonB-dependent receptor [Sphingomonadales bacterium]